MPASLVRTALATFTMTAALLVAVSTRAATQQPMTLDTPTGAIAGTVMRPDGMLKVPIVLLIAGSGPTDRDGNGLGTPVHPDNLKLLATTLADAGFATLRYDKRGIGESVDAMPREDDVRFESYVDDAAAWVTKLGADARFTGVAIVGHSEGSLIGMLAARRGNVRALVSAAGPARGAADVLRAQLRGKLPPDLVDRNEAILAALQKGVPADNIPPALASLYRPSVQPFLISYFRYVPATVFSGLTIPCMIVQGDSDVQIAVSEAQALYAANPAAELLVVPGMSHVLKIVPPGPSGQKATYTDPTLPLAPALIEGIVAFLARSMSATAH